MGFPGRDEEVGLAQRMLGGTAPEVTLASGAVRPVIGSAELATAKAALDAITVREEVVAYLVDIVRRTRGHESVLVGAGPRATQALLVGARANAAINDRDYATPDDVKLMAVPVLEHRLVLRPEFEIEGVTVGEIIERILTEVAVPR
jgi:MoxR-like ATPase